MGHGTVHSWLMYELKPVPFKGNRSWLGTDSSALRSGRFRAVLADGTDGVMVSVTGLDLRVAEGWWNQRLDRRNALPCAVAFAAITA